MRVLFRAVVLCGAIAAVPASAQGWSSQGSATGPRGHTVTRSGGGSCSDASCASSGTVTGPRGETAVRNSTGSCADGTCTRTSTETGPRGRQTTRQATVSRTGTHHSR